MPGTKINLKGSICSFHLWGNVHVCIYNLSTLTQETMVITLYTTCRSIVKCLFLMRIHTSLIIISFSTIIEPRKDLEAIPRINDERLSKPAISHMTCLTSFTVSIMSDIPHPSDIITFHGCVGEYMCNNKN